MRKTIIALLTCVCISYVNAQTDGDTLPGEVTLQQAVQYSLKNQPLIRQSLVDQEITEANIRSRLSEWYPQLNVNYNMQHNFVVQTAVIGGNKVKLGTDNVSNFQFTVSQTIFDRDVLLASRTRYNRATPGATGHKQREYRNSSSGIQGIL
jgi:outer membrane protein TolC